MLLCRWLVYFVIYSFLGWVYETIVCTIRWKKWENRGFLYGPICPIYGTGAVGSMIVIDIVDQRGISYSWWQVFIFSMLASIVLEFTQSASGAERVEAIFTARYDNRCILILYDVQGMYRSYWNYQSSSNDII